MSVFDAYEQELNSLNKELDRNINELKQCGADKTKANTLISIIDEKITEYGNLMKEAEMEVRGYDLATRRQLNEKIEFHRKLLKDSKLDFARAREVSERSELMGAQSALDRQRMLDVNEKLENQNDAISRAHRTVAETEEIGMEIMGELERNREKIESSREKAKEFQGVTDSARRILTSMTKREWSMGFFH